MPATLLTVFGTRPQFVKVSAVSNAIEAEARRRRMRLRHVVVDTGQHWDDRLAGVFERELGIRRPDAHLSAGGGSALSQVSRMLARLEPLLEKTRPDLVLVYGDTNSTLAGALAAARLGIPIAHVESGLRSFVRNQPEEVNRAVADRLSTLLFCPTRTAVANLRREGIRSGVVLSGDAMRDALALGAPAPAEARAILSRFGVARRGYRLVTAHRAANTDSREAVTSLLAVLKAVPKPAIFPMHPRTASAIRRFAGPSALSRIENLRAIPPVGYREMIALEGNASAILTDSGGVQKEAFWLGVPCVTLRDETEWVETVKAGWNALAGLNPARVLRALSSLPAPGRVPERVLARALGPKGASRRIARQILGFLDD